MSRTNNVKSLNDHNVKTLIAMLREKPDRNEQKRIRRTLRAKGHFGGLRTSSRVVATKRTSKRAKRERANVDASNIDANANA